MTLYYYSITLSPVFLNFKKFPALSGKKIAEEEEAINHDFVASYRNRINSKKNTNKKYINFAVTAALFSRVQSKLVI